MTIRPAFRALPASRSRALLARNVVGRLAFMNDPFIDIEPIGYVLRTGWLYMRSANGSKLRALARKPYAAFEVDEVRGPFDWDSVVVQGTIYHLPEDGSPADRAARKRAITAFRRRARAAFTPRDPVPERHIVYGLHIDRITGRAARQVAVGRRK